MTILLVALFDHHLLNPLKDFHLQALGIGAGVGGRSNKSNVQDPSESAACSEQGILIFAQKTTLVQTRP